jgi:uncharacterized membrane protein HdeD (DUF308 family)
MSKKNAEIIFYFREIPNLQKRWSSFLGFGILLVVLGILGIAFAAWTTLFTIELLGVLLILGGVFLLMNGWHARKWVGVSISILLGILYVVLGAICIFKPVASAAAVTLLIAALFFIGGLFRMCASVIYRFDHWGLLFFNGLISFILGILIFMEWPIAAFWVIGLFVGIDLLFSGLNWIFLSLAAKNGLNG